MMISKVLDGRGNRLIVCICEGTFRGEMTGPNPTDRGKIGTKRNVLTDQRGIPVSVIITSANTHDMKTVRIDWIM